MKKHLLFVAFFIYSLSFSQITLSNLMPLTTLNDSEISEYIKNVFGFKEIELPKDSMTKVLFVNEKRNGENIGILTFKPDVTNNRNNIVIFLGYNINIDKIKSDIISNNYEYKGLILEKYVYTNKDYSITIDQKPNSNNNYTMFIINLQKQ